MRRISRTSFPTLDRRIAALLFLAACAATAIVYASAQKYNPAQPSQGYSDSRDYMAMAKGLPGRGLRAYRPLVPWLAAHVPSPPRVFFDSPATADDDRHLARRFAIVNTLFLIGACAVLLQLFTALGLTLVETCAGLALFLTAPPVVAGAGLPMTDAAFWFFLSAALLAAVQGRPLLYLAIVTIGVLAKELVLLSLPVVLFLRMPVRRRLAFIAASLPAIALVIALRSGADSAEGRRLGFSFMARTAAFQLGNLATPHGIADVALAFGLAWIPAILSIRQPLPPMLKRVAVLIPVVVLGEILFGNRNTSRGFFSAFPAVIPLAAVSLGSWLQGTRRRPEE